MLKLHAGYTAKGPEWLKNLRPTRTSLFGQTVSMSDGPSASKFRGTSWKRRRLAGQVLLAVPDATVIGVDASKTFGRYVNQQFGIEVLEADLAGLEWAEGIEGCFDLVYTLQSMHDIGGEEAISKIYQACAKLIAPGGWLMVADFVVTEEAFDPDKPGRLPIAWHLGALSDAGFSAAVCSLETGKLACMVGDMPD